jgi:indolepyruvate ferredoxin oxidoreductase, beta subunit
MANKIKICNVLFCGIGGQGIVKASEVAGVAAMNSGYRVKKSEVHGMAQRGGSVESHLRFGTVVNSPLIMPGEADFLVSFDKGEGVRMRGFLKKGGIDFTPILSRTGMLCDARFVNTLFLGALAAMLPFPLKNWHDALKTVMAKNMDENRKVFAMGLDLGRDMEEW